MHALHVWAWGLYFGSLVYVYFRLVPDARRHFASDERLEAFSLTTADGLRWWIFGALGLAGATGVALLAIRPPPLRDTTFWALVGVKAGLLVATLAVYTYVSYVMWPRRVFVAREDRPAEQHRFLRVAYLLMALLAAQALAGAALHLR